MCEISTYFYLFGKINGKQKPQRGKKIAKAEIKIKWERKKKK